MKLNLPTYNFRTKIENEKDFIWDDIRKKYVRLTPEEWVRQNFLQYLIQEKKVPSSLIGIENEIKLHGLSKRTDIAVFSKAGKPLLLVECKAPQVKLNQNVFEQIAVYNLKLQVEHLIVTNGIIHFYCKINLKTGTLNFLKNIPGYTEL